MSKAKSAEKVVQDIRRKTRRRFSAEEKIRIVLEGLRGEESIATLCRREGLNPYKRVPFHQLHAVPLTQLPNDSPNPTSHPRRRSRVSDTSAPTPRDICNPIGRGIGSATLA